MMAAALTPPTDKASSAAKTLLDLPFQVLGQRIVAHPALDAASRLALFRTSHTLARMVLQHAPGSKQLTAGRWDNSSSDVWWSSSLLHLLGTKWQPLHLAGLELRTRGDLSNLWPHEAATALTRGPPAAISRHVSHLHLHKCKLTPGDLAAWQLHDATLWPHLQHLTVTSCSFEAEEDIAAASQQLQPIPLLRSFAWHDTSMWLDVDADALSCLAAIATHTRVDLPWRMQDHSIKVLKRLQHLTHAHLHECHGEDVLVALLQHPTLQHVTVEGISGLFADLSQQPCRWTSLTLLRWMDVRDPGRLPLANLERFTIHGRLCVDLDYELAWNDGEERRLAVEAGVAVLQQLHSGGRLVLLPCADDDRDVREWQLPPDCGLFDVRDVGSCAPALVRLVLEAGPGIRALQLDGEALAPACFHQEVAPLLQRFGSVHTLCVTLPWRPLHEAALASLLGALPTCIAHVKVQGDLSRCSSQVKSLVQGGAASLAHPLTLTVLPYGWVERSMAAELMQLAAGSVAVGGAATTSATRAPLLTLEVVKPLPSQAALPARPAAQAVRPATLPLAADGTRPPGATSSGWWQRLCDAVAGLGMG